MEVNLFGTNLSQGLESFLADTNPWWCGRELPPLPTYRRWAFLNILSKFKADLAPITVLRGPRQVGKTTLQNQVIEHLLRKEKIAPNRILRVQFDEIQSLKGIADPILNIARWFEDRILGGTFNSFANRNQPAYLFFDEVQNLNNWATQLKALVDHHAVKVLVTGSSALRIEQGRDSLAGRIASIEIGTLLLREIAGVAFQQNFTPFLQPNGLEPLLKKSFWQDLQKNGERLAPIRNSAFAAFSEKGGYPMAQSRPNASWQEIADQLNESVIKRAIKHDLRVGQKGAKRDETLLEEVFRLACKYAGQAPGQAVYVNSLKQSLEGNIGWQRILSYLNFLDSAMLIKLIDPLELRLKRKKGNKKIALCDHGLRASWLQESIPLHAEGLRSSPHLHDLAGHIAESVVGYFLGNLPQAGLAHFPERGAEPEVDFVLTLGEKRVPIEIKYRFRIDPQRDTLGLRSFLEKTVYNAPFGILVTLEDGVVVDDPRIVTVSLPSLLLMR